MGRKNRKKTVSSKAGTQRSPRISHNVAWIGVSKQQRSKLGQLIFSSLFLILLLVFIGICGYVGRLILKSDTYARIEEVLAPALKAEENFSTGDPARPPQLVALSFDGSYSLEMWDETLDFARDASRRNAPVDFTYFISGVYFLAPENASLYQAPRRKPGESAIEFADGLEDIALRIDKVNRAVREGHEIASHANGHYLGSDWTFDEWMQEFSEFNELLFDIQKNNPGLPKKHLALNPKDITGFRAPELGSNTALFKVLKEMGFRYDSSTISSQRRWPTQTEGIWNYPLVSIEVGKEKTPVLSMDYSLYHHQSRVKDVAARNSETWRKFHQDLYEAYMKYFSNHYEGNRAPIFIANHFSKWNDGVYWEVMQRFVLSVCGQPEVYCVTFEKLTDYLDSLTPEQLAAYQKGNFPRLEL